MYLVLLPLPFTLLWTWSSCPFPSHHYRLWTWSSCPFPSHHCGPGPLVPSFSHHCRPGPLLPSLHTYVDLVLLPLPVTPLWTWSSCPFPSHHCGPGPLAHSLHTIVDLVLLPIPFTPHSYPFLSQLLHKSVEILTLAPLCSRSFMMLINSWWLRLPSPSESKIWKTVLTTWGPKVWPVQTLTARWKSSVTGIEKNSHTMSRRKSTVTHEMLNPSTDMFLYWPPKTI